MIAEAEIMIGVGDKEVQVTALVQDEAPHDLLLGTDCLAKLDF